MTATLGLAGLSGIPTMNPYRALLTFVSPAPYCGLFGNISYERVSTQSRGPIRSANVNFSISFAISGPVKVGPRPPRFLLWICSPECKEHVGGT